MDFWTENLRKLMISFIFREFLLSNNRLFTKSISGIFGVGISTGLRLIAYVGFKKSITIDFLNKYFFSIISTLIASSFVTGDYIKNNVKLMINSLIGIKHYRGLRHSTFLPTRGQRTCSNAETRRKLRN